VLPIVLVLLAITICLSPVSLIGGALLAIAWAFGLIAIGTEVGKRLAEIFKQEWAIAVEAALGTFILILVFNGAALIPCVGWLLRAVVGIVGLGAVLLTRFGTQDYPPALPAQGSAGAPPTPPSEALPPQDASAAVSELAGPPPEPPAAP
jgi:energy-coupling factor transporter transmembrane protein EcfT